MINRRKSRKIKVGNTFIGGNSPITVQSMLNIPAENTNENVASALSLQAAGCDIIRVAVPTVSDVKLIYALKNALNIPVVADIHFDYKIAVECAMAGVDKIRINPGNIGEKSKIKAVADVCNLKNIPIRIGVNSGSLEREILAKYSNVTAEALTESALLGASQLEEFDFHNIILSLKSSNLPMMYNAYKLCADKCDYPLHLGVTEAGTFTSGLIKSCAGIGGLLLEGIGDTIRISLTDEPVKEVICGIKLLKSLMLRNGGIEFISCPTCGRTKIDVISITNEIESKLGKLDKNIKVAIMGCVVNGPGEAKEADIGICGGDHCGVIIKKGVVIRKVAEENLVAELIHEIEKM